MDQIDYVKLLGQGGIAVAALLALARIVYRVGERMIVAIDRVSLKIDEHTKADTSALAAVSTNVSSLRQDIAVLSERVDTVIEWNERTTPVAGIHHRPELPEPELPQRPTGEYSYKRTPRGGGGGGA